MSAKPVCPECGSDNVLLDAWASWNHDKQAFEVAATFDVSAHVSANEAVSHADDS